MDGLCAWDENGANPQCKNPPSTPFAQLVWDLAFSSDGSLLASGGDEAGFAGAAAWNSLSVWNSTTGQLLWSRGHLGQGVVPIAFSPDSRSLVAATGDGSLLVFDSRTGKEGKHVSLSAAGCGGLRFTP